MLSNPMFFPEPFLQQMLVQFSNIYTWTKIKFLTRMDYLEPVQVSIYIWTSS